MPVLASKSGITRLWDNSQWDAMDGSKNGWTLIERFDYEIPIARRPYAEVAPPNVLPAGSTLLAVIGEEPIEVFTSDGIATVGLIDGTVDGYVLTWNNSTGVWEEQAATQGTVTSVGLDLPASVFNVTVSPVTSAGTLTAEFDTQNDHTFFAGPTAGGPLTPAFRTMVLGDLPQIDTQRLLGRDTAGTGDVESITLSTVLDWLSSAQGAVLYRGASGWAALPPGTSGYFLKTQGGAANPIWDAASGVGGSGSGLVNRVAYWISATNISADDDFLFNGAQVGIGTTTLTDRLNLDGDTRFYNGQFKFGRYSGTVPTAYATVQIEAKASGIASAATPSEDAGIILRGRSSGGTVYDQSLHFGVDTNSNYGTFIQARAHNNYNTYYTLRINPRGGRVSVGRPTSTANSAVMTVFATTFGASGAGPYLLNLESSEGTAKLGFSTGNDLVHSSQWYDGVNLIMRTSCIRSETWASIRWSIGTSETADKMILMPNSNGRLGVGYSSTSGIHSTIQSAGSFAGAILETVGAPTFDETKNVIIYTSTSNVTWTLPAASSCQGRRYILHHANTAGTITLSSSVTKGNGGNFNTLSAGEWAWIVSTGSGWRGYKLTSS